MDRRRVEIDLSLIDGESVNKAIGGIVQKLASAERHALGLKRALDSIKGGRGGAGGSVGFSPAGAASIQRQAMSDAAKMARLRENLQAAEQRAAVRATRSAEATKRRDMAKTERQRIAAERQVTREAQKAEAAKIRAQRVSERMAAIDRRNAVGSARREAALDRRHNAAAGRIFERERARGERFRGNAARLEARDSMSRGRMLWGGAMSPVKAATGIAGSAGRMVAGGLALGGAAGVYDVVHKSIAVEGLAGDIENLTNGKYSAKEIQNLAAASGKQTGISSIDTLSGLSEFIAKAGDADTGMRNLPTFGKVARATGSSVEDIASTAADLSKKFGIKSVQDMTDALGLLTQQGKDGSFELKDMAKQFPKIGAAAANYGLTGIEGVKQLGGFAQIARRGVGNSESAATSVEQFFNQISKKAGKLESGEYGEKFSVYNKFGDRSSGTKDLFTLIPGLIDSVQGDMGSMIKILDARGNRAVSTLLKDYNSKYFETYKNTRGPESARRQAATAAVRKELEKTINVQGDSAMLDRDFSRRMGKTDAKLGQAGEELRTEIGQRLLPALVQAIPKFVEMIPALVQLTDQFLQAAPALLELSSGLASLGLKAAAWATENPVAAALAAVAFGIAKAAATSFVASTGAKLLGGVTTSGGIAGGATIGAGAAATMSQTAGRFSLAKAGARALGMLGLAVGAEDLFGSLFFPEGEELASKTENRKRLSVLSSKYVSRFGGDAQKMETLRGVREQVANGGELGADAKQFVATYLGVTPDQVSNGAGLTSIDRSSITGIIDREIGRSAPLAPGPIASSSPGDTSTAFGYGPMSTNAGDAGASQVDLSQFTVAGEDLRNAALAIIEASNANKESAQQIRDSLAQKGVFR